MVNAAAAAAGTGSTSIGNVYSLAAFIPTFDGSYPVQDFLEEINDAAKIGNWADNITLKVAKSKIQGPVADMVRNRHDLNHAATFEDFQSLLISALNTDNRGKKKARTRPRAWETQREKHVERKRPNRYFYIFKYYESENIFLGKYIEHIQRNTR